MRSRGLAVAKLAHSGVAAHLIGGQTIHHFFSLDIDYSNSTLEHSTTQTTLLMGQWTNSLKVLMLLSSRQSSFLDGKMILRMRLITQSVGSLGMCSYYLTLHSFLL